MDIDKKLDFWLTNNFNVLLEGGHGIGKTALIEQCFKRNNINYKYFSAATMDPWVDFVGVPKEQTDELGSYLELIRPREFRDDDIQVIFLDEFNRAAPKVRNAVMELLQFKSINGRKFNNLRCVWAAINPIDEDGTYDVDRLDPAQQDRFEVQFKIPETPSLQFFTDTHGIIGQRAVEWWNTIPDEVIKHVSPRRLEYAINMYKLGGDLNDVLHKLTKPNVLKSMIERVDDSVSHLEMWQRDPELYITQMCSRRSGVPIDIVEAFYVLKRMSLDQAISYYDRLPSNKKTLIACDARTVSIAIQSRPSRATTQALESIVGYDTRDTTAVWMDIAEQYPTTLAQIMKRVVAQNSIDATDWNALRLWVQQFASDAPHAITHCISQVCVHKLNASSPLTKSPTSSSLGRTILSVMHMLYIKCSDHPHTMLSGAYYMHMALHNEKT